MSTDETVVAVKRSTLQSYQRRLHLVNDHVHRHLDEPIDLDRLARIACLSPCHWHRIYEAIQGETIGNAVRRLRLQRAAHQLANTPESIDRIAGAAGYSSVAAFTRRFRTAYGLPPARYRVEGGHRRYDVASPSYDGSTFRVDVISIPAIQCAAVVHSGDYMGIGQAFDRLQHALISSGRSNDSIRSYGVYFGDPSLVPEAKLESLACAAPLSATDIACARKIDGGVRKHVLAAGMHAVLHHRGPLADLPAAYRWLYGQWLPASGREPADLPCHERYLNEPRSTPPMEIQVDIHLPLKPA